MRQPSFALLAAFAASSCVLGCSDTAGPRTLHPMAGMYEITATMDSAGFRQSCYPQQGYCFPNAPTNGMVAVSGLLTVGDSLELAGDGSQSKLAVTGTMTLQGCVSDGTAYGCASRSPAETGVYAGAIMEEQLANPPMSFVLRRPTSLYGVSLGATSAGDSLYGTLGFIDYGQTRYSGRFVAHRRPR